MDLNKAQIIGNITRDIELKETPNGMKVTNFGVATNRNWTDGNGMRQEQTEFHNVVLWGKLAEIAGEYLSKGQKVYIEGRLQTRSWEGQDGSKRYTTEIVGENMIMLGNRGEASSSSAPQGATPTTKQSKPDAEEEISIEDIPF
ncbi:MAG: single-stranded DNA-binding protein [Candidatus Gracilibacteria bacterium]|nr:single-stranded DNA-binding protein [Candidatus Gracilibacteria bacterium]